MKRNKHRKLGPSYWERAAVQRMLPKPKCGRRVGLLAEDCAPYTLGEQWQRILEGR